MARRNGTNPRIHYADLSESGRMRQAEMPEEHESLLDDDEPVESWLAKHKGGVIAAVIAALFGSGGYVARLATTESRGADNAKAIDHQGERLGAVEVRVTAMESAVQRVDENVGGIKVYIERQAEKNEAAKDKRIEELEKQLRRRDR